MKKTLSAIMIVLITVVLCACNSDPESAMRNNPGFKLEAKGYIQTRASAISAENYIIEETKELKTGTALYINYSVLKPLTKEQEKQIVEYDVMGCSGEFNQKRNNNEYTREITDADAAFYKGDSDELIDRLVYSKGKWLQPNDYSYFLPADDIQRPISRSNP